jgi:hypothetical protein
MTEELLGLCEQDENPALRAKLFKRYPQLKEEHELYERAADPSAPRWRLWMEVSNLLIREFEQRYGSLRQDHGALFKELSAKVLNHHLELIDGVVGQIIENLDALFPEVHAEWVIMPSQETFASLPMVRRQAQRYGIGPEQIFLNVIEALGSQGRVVVSVDDEQYFRTFLLPSDTGLTKSEERVLFLRPEERKQADSDRNRERVRRARNKYANYLIERGGSVLADFVNGNRVRSVDAALELIAAVVNEALDLLPVDNRNRLVKLDHVIDRFDAIRQGHRSFPFPLPKREPLVLVEADEAPEPKATKKKASRKKKASKKKKKKAPKKKASKKKKKASKKKASKKKASKKKAPKKKKKASKKKASKKKKKASKKKASKKKAPKKKASKKKKKASKKKASKKKASKKKASKKKKKASKKKRRR